MDSNDTNVPDDAPQHYDKHTCNHPGCVVLDAPSIVAFFSRMKEDVKIDTVRMILLALTSRVVSSSEGNCATHYMMRGEGFVERHF